MSLYTIVGDPHAKPTNLDKINQLFDIIEDLGNPTIFLGDLLDTKELVRGKCLNTYFDRLSQSNLEFTILVGNHDWFNLQCEEHSLKPLSLLPNVDVIDKPTHSLLGKSCKTLFLPYIHNPEQFKAELKQAPSTVFCHADISGFDYGNGYISKHPIKKDDFLDFKIVISGHYHKYQEVGNITYLGTPFSHSFGESNQDKYIGLFDTEKQMLNLLNSPFPKHMTYEVAAGDIKLDLDKDNYNRVIVSGPKDLVDATKLDNVKLIKHYIESSTKRIVNETQSPEVQFERWAKEIKELTPETVQLGIEILKNV